MSVIPVQQILKYTNQARANPVKFSEYVKKQYDMFISDMQLPMKKNCNYQTNQGKKQWLSTINWLKSQKPLPALKLHQGLSLAAMDHAIDMRNNEFFDHSSSDGTDMSTRIQRRCGKAYGSSGENLGSTFNVEGRQFALQTVMGLIIDDGVPSRGHRDNIFSPTYTSVGIYSVIMGDKVRTVMDFHSGQVKLVNDSKDPILPKGGNKSNSNHQQAVKPSNGHHAPQQHSGEKYAASTSTSTKTSTVNGKTTKIVTTKITYSDGSTEQRTETTSN